MVYYINPTFILDLLNQYHYTLESSELLNGSKMSKTLGPKFHFYPFALASQSPNSRENDSEIKGISKRILADFSPIFPQYHILDPSLAISQGIPSKGVAFPDGRYMVPIQDDQNLYFHLFLPNGKFEKYLAYSNFSLTLLQSIPLNGEKFAFLGISSSSISPNQAKMTIGDYYGKTLCSINLKFSDGNIALSSDPFGYDQSFFVVSGLDRGRAKYMVYSIHKEYVYDITNPPYYTLDNFGYRVLSISSGILGNKAIVLLQSIIENSSQKRKIFFQFVTTTGLVSSSQTTIAENNTYELKNPTIAPLDNNTGFIVGWINSGDNMIYYSRFDSSGSQAINSVAVNEIPVNSSLSSLKVLGLVGTGYVIAWNNDKSILFQIYTANNTKFNSNYIFNSSGTINLNYGFDLIAMKDGGFAVQLYGLGQDIDGINSNSQAPFIVRFNSDGSIYYTYRGQMKFDIQKKGSEYIEKEFISPSNCSFETSEVNLTNLAYKKFGRIGFFKSYYIDLNGSITIIDDKGTYFSTKPILVSSLSVDRVLDVDVEGILVTEKESKIYAKIDYEGNLLYTYSLKTNEDFSFSVVLYSGKLLLGFTEDSNLKARILTSQLGEIITVELLTIPVSPKVKPLAFGGFAIAYIADVNYFIRVYDDFGNLMMSKNGSDLYIISSIDVIDLSNGGIALSYINSLGRLSLLTFDYLFNSNPIIQNFDNVQGMTLTKTASGFALIYFRYIDWTYQYYTNVYTNLNTPYYQELALNDSRWNHSGLASVSYTAQEGFLFYFLGSNFLMKHQRQSCNSTYFIQADSQASCTGSDLSPCDSLWKMLLRMGEAENATVYVLKNSDIAHYAILDDSPDMHSKLWKTKTLKSLTIKPLSCEEASVSYPSLMNNCTTGDEKIRIFVKSMIMVNAISLTMENIIIDGTENIASINSDSNQAALNSCLSGRFKCCDASSMDSPGLNGLYCKRKVAIKDYDAFQLESPINVLSDLTLKNCEFYNLHSVDHKSLFNIAEGMSTVAVYNTSFNQIFFRVGVFYAQAMSIYFTGKGINFTNYNDWGLINSNYEAESLEEGYFLYGYRINLTLSNSTFENAGFQISGCPQKFINFYQMDQRGIINQFQSKSDIVSRCSLYSTESNSLINIKSTINAGVYNCVFKNVIGKIGAVLSLKFNQKTQGVFEIAGNSFEKNFASHAFSTILIEKRGYDLRANIIFNNIFRENFGCLESFGNIFINYQDSIASFPLNITSNTFVNNYQAISSSIALYNVTSFNLIRNNFLHNGGPSGDFGINLLDFSYFATMYNTNTKTNGYSSFAQSTVLYIDSINDLSTDSNRFEQNWGPFEGSNFLGDLISIKNYRGGKTGIKFANDSFYDHSSGVNEFVYESKKIFFYGSTWLITIIASKGYEQDVDEIMFENCTVEKLSSSFSKKNFLRDFSLNKFFKAEDRSSIGFLKVGDSLNSQDLDIEIKDDSYNRNLLLSYKNCSFKNLANDGRGSLMIGNFRGNLIIFNTVFDSISDFTILIAIKQMTQLTIERSMLTNLRTDRNDGALFQLQVESSYFDMLKIQNILLSTSSLFDFKVTDRSKAYLYNLSINSCKTQNEAFNMIGSFGGYFYLQNITMTDSSPLIRCQACIFFTWDLSINNPIQLSQASYIGNFSSDAELYIYNASIILSTPLSYLNFISGELKTLFVSRSKFFFSHFGDSVLFSGIISNMTMTGNLISNQATTNQNKLFELKSSSNIEIKNNVFYNLYRLITLTNVAGSLVIRNNIFEINEPSTLISISQTNSALITIASNTFNSKRIPLTLPSFLISITDQSQLCSIYNNSFITPSGSKGIILIQSSYNYYNTLFQKNLFFNSIGTPIRLSSTNLQTLSSFGIPSAKIYNNLFSMNRALALDSQGGHGGSIAILTTDYSTQVTDITGNSFIMNVAQLSGGAIYFNWNLPNMSSNYFLNNFALKMNHIYSFPVRLALYRDSRAEYKAFDPSEKTRMLQEASSLDVKEFPSGIDTVINYSFALVDMFDQLYFTDSSSYLTINPQGYSISNLSKFTAMSSIQARDGIYEISTLNFKYHIGQGLDIYFNSTAIPSQPNPSTSPSPSLKLSFTFRNCLPGEYLLPDSTCSSCSPSNWLPTIHNNSEGPCLKCDTSKLICKGGSKVGPLPGYWLFNASSDNVMACPYPDACLGNLEENEMLEVKGRCAEGYEGNLCANCKLGFGKFGSSGKCSDCKNDEVYYLKVVAAVVGSVALSVYGVVDTLKSIMTGFSDQEEKRSVFMRILMNYLQLVSLIGKIDIEWPGSISTLVSLGGEVGSALQASLNAECLYNNRELSIRLVNVKYLTTQLTPFALVGINVAFWNVRYKIKGWTRGTQEFYNKIVLTTVVICYNILPQTIISCLNMFRCKNLYRNDTPIYHLSLDYDMECWTQEHLVWALGINVPFLMLWAVVIPLFIFKKLRKNKKNFDEQDFRQKYSFLYNGYKREYYYWEFVLLLRKIISIMVVVFVSIKSLFLQTFMLTIISFIFTFIHNTSMPYEKKEINKVETFSLLSSICSSMLALYIYASQYFPDGFEGVFTVIGLVSMLGFLAFWLREYVKTYNKAAGSVKNIWIKLKSQKRVCCKDKGSFRRKKLNLRTGKIKMANFEHSLSTTMEDTRILDDNFKTVTELRNRLEIEDNPMLGGLENILKPNLENKFRSYAENVEKNIETLE